MLHAGRGARPGRSCAGRGAAAWAELRSEGCRGLGAELRSEGRRGLWAELRRRGAAAWVGRNAATRLEELEAAHLEEQGGGARS